MTAASSAAGTASLPSVPSARAARLAGRRWLRGIGRRWSGWLGLATLAIMLLSALAAPVLAPRDPNAIDLAHKLEGTTAEHWLGTDHLGRDELSRLLHGGRTALIVGLLSVAGSLLLAMVAGGLSGYSGGTVDLLVTGMLNVLLAVPGLILTLAILGIMGTGQLSLLLALIGAGWAGQARIIRGDVLEARERGYVEAARVVGGGNLYVLVRHILPNVAGTLAVLATLDLAGVLLTVSSLSFLGIGVQPPQSDWGIMLADSRAFAGTYPRLMLLPGSCIVIFAVAANLAGDTLRDLLDPHRR